MVLRVYLNNIMALGIEPTSSKPRVYLANRHATNIIALLTTDKQPSMKIISQVLNDRFVKSNESIIQSNRIKLRSLLQQPGFKISAGNEPYNFLICRR